jgi:hypothetical protein
MRCAPFLALLALAPVLACAQEVHKCTQDGHVTYQATPCPGADKVLPLTAGPGEGDVEAARQRAAAQKARAAEGAAPAASASHSERAADAKV